MDIQTGSPGSPGISNFGAPTDGAVNDDDLGQVMFAVPPKVQVTAI